MTQTIVFQTGIKHAQLIPIYYAIGSIVFSFVAHEKPLMR
jgi:hypothetical protein